MCSYLLIRELSKVTSVVKILEIYTRMKIVYYIIHLVLFSVQISQKKGQNWVPSDLILRIVVRIILMLSFTESDKIQLQKKTHLEKHKRCYE